MSTRRQFLGQASGLAALSAFGTSGILAPASAWAADKWPTKPIRLVVPYPAGGSSDIIARLISKPLGEALGQAVVVDNRPGANGNIGAAMVAQAGTGQPHAAAVRCGRAGHQPVRVHQAELQP